MLAPATSSPARIWPVAAVVVFAYLAGGRISAGPPVPATVAGVAVALVVTRS